MEGWGEGVESRVRWETYLFEEENKLMEGWGEGVELESRVRWETYLFEEGDKLLEGWGEGVESRVRWEHDPSAEQIYPELTIP